MTLSARVAFLALAVLIPSSCAPSAPRVAETIRYGSDTEEQRLSIEGKPVFTNHRGQRGLEIATPENHAVWPLEWPEEKISRRKLDVGKIYRFEWLKERIGRRSETTDELVRISDGEKTLYDASLCNVHHIGMTRQLEDVESGGEFTKYFYKHRRQLFPNDGKAYLWCDGGVRHLVWKCPECAKLAEREIRRNSLPH